MNLYHLYSISSGSIVRRDIPHPRTDEGSVEGLDSDLVLLRIVRDPAPSHDATTHQPEAVEVIDLVAGECRVTWQVIDLPAEVVATNLLSERRSEMAAILDGLPLEQQASLWATRVAVEEALDRGRIDLGRQMVIDAVIPPELEPTRAAILDLFPPL